MSLSPLRLSSLEHQQRREEIKREEAVEAATADERGSGFRKAANGGRLGPGSRACERGPRSPDPPHPQACEWRAGEEKGPEREQSLTGSIGASQTHPRPSPRSRAPAQGASPGRRASPSTGRRLVRSPSLRVRLPPGPVPSSGHGPVACIRGAPTPGRVACGGHSPCTFAGPGPMCHVCRL